MLDFYRKDESSDTTDDSESGLPGTLADVNRIMVGENAASLLGHFPSRQKQASWRCSGLVPEPYLLPAISFHAI